jgi:chromosome condensin MukBEF ATPase and DNA-binding subunit MukB
MQDERNQALDRVNLLDMELTAVRSAVNDVQGALQREQQRSVELADAVAAKDKVGFGGW